MLIFLFLFSCINVRSQYVFEITCTIPGTTNTKANGLVFTDGMNPDFMRLSFIDSASNQPVILDMEFHEESNKMAEVPALNYSSFLMTPAVVTKVVSGKWNKQFTEIRLWFFMGTGSTGKFIPCVNALPYYANMPEDYLVNNPNGYRRLPDVPVTVTDSGAFMTDTVASNILAYRELSKQQLTKSFLLKYFVNRELNYPGPYTPKQLTTIQQLLYTSMFCIVVTNNLDPAIKASCLLDKENVTGFFRSAAAGLHIKYQQTEINGNNFSVQGVINAIKKLPVKENDIVVFAYSGHGFSYTDDNNYPFAQMALFYNDSTKAQYRAHSMNLETVFKMINAKGARLNIVMGDCCNSLINIPRYEDSTKQGLYAPPSPAQLRRNLLHMFVDTKGSYLLGATKKGQYAAGNFELGGIFTSSFISILTGFSQSTTELNAATVWDDIIKRTESYSKDQSSRIICAGGNYCEQDMIYKAVPKK